VSGRQAGLPSRRGRDVPAEPEQLTGQVGSLHRAPASSRRSRRLNNRFASGAGPPEPVRPPARPHDLRQMRVCSARVRGMRRPDDLTEVIRRIYENHRLVGQGFRRAAMGRRQVLAKGSNGVGGRPNWKRPATEVHAPTEESREILRVPAEFGRAEVRCSPPSIPERAIIMLTVKGPYIEILDPCHPIHVVECRTLAQRSAQKSASVPSRPAGIPLEKTPFRLRGDQAECGWSSRPRRRGGRGPITLSPTSPGSGQASARSRRPPQRTRAGRVEDQVKTGGQVLEPRRPVTSGHGT